MTIRRPYALCVFVLFLRYRGIWTAGYVTVYMLVDGIGSYDSSYFVVLFRYLTVLSKGSARRRVAINSFEQLRRLSKLACNSK